MTNKQAAVNTDRRTDRRKNQGPKNVKFFNGVLQCQRCRTQWQVVDLNEERRAVKCPICNEYNDIKGAKV